jgi:hypothetical protein
MMYSFKQIFLSSVIGANLLLTGCGAGTATSGQEGAQTNETLNELLNSLQGLVNGNNAGQINVDTTGNDSIIITIPRNPDADPGLDTAPVPPIDTYVVAVTDSNNDGHSPLWALDSNLAGESRWSAQPANNIAPWIQYELSNTISIDSVQIAFFLGDVRATTFQIETSVNGNEWDVALLETSAGTAESYESFAFETRLAKYVRLVGFGNTMSAWTSILEMSIPGVTVTDTLEIPPVVQPLPEDNTPPEVTPEVPDILEPEVGNDPIDTTPPVSATPVDIVSVTDSNNDGHLPALTVDGSLADESRWSASLATDQANAWIEYELSGNIEFSSIDIAFFKGNVRTTKFDVLVSLDGAAWQLVHSATSSGSTSNFETFSFEKVIASYIRIQGYGNSVNSWNSILEVNIPKADKTSWTASNPVEPTLPVLPPVVEVPQVQVPVVVNPPITGGTLISTAQQLKDALAAAKGGEVFLLKDGNYGSLVISRQFPSYVTLRAVNLHKAVFSNIEINGSNKGFVQFDRIQSGGIRATNGAHHLKYTNSRFSSTVYFKTAADIIVDNNIIDVDGGLHALLMNSVSRFELTRNFIARAQEDLMRLTGDSDGGSILNNVFYDTMPKNIPHDANKCEYNHSDGLQMFGADNKNPRNITIRGNYFYDDPSNNQIRPEACAGGKTDYRLNMQGLFLSDPQGNAYENVLIEENFAYLGSANSIVINGATSNVVVRNNTLLPWTEGRGGSIRIVETAKRTNKGLTLYGNSATAVSDETTSLSNGMNIHSNLVYDKSSTSSPIHRNNLFQGGGEGSRWQYFLPVTGSAVDFGSTYGSQKRLQELMQSKSGTMPVQFQ